MITRRYIPALPLICMLMMQSVFVNGEESRESAAPLETKLIANAQRLFDAPQVANDIANRPEPIPSVGVNTVASESLLFIFNGVISHEGIASVWVNNLPFALLHTTMSARRVRWNDIESVLEVTLNNGKEIKLLPGQALFKAADGSSFVRDEVK